MLYNFSSSEGFSKRIKSVKCYRELAQLTFIPKSQLSCPNLFFSLELGTNDQKNNAMPTRPQLKTKSFQNYVLHSFYRGGLKYTHYFLQRDKNK